MEVERVQDGPLKKSEIVRFLEASKTSYKTVDNFLTEKKELDVDEDNEYEDMFVKNSTTLLTLTLIYELQDMSEEGKWSIRINYAF